MAPKPQLLRLVLDRGSDPPRRVLIDGAATQPGRGAYLCPAADRGSEPPRPNPACLELATARAGLSRALRSPLSTPIDFVESSFR